MQKIIVDGEIVSIVSDERADDVKEMYKAQYPNSSVSKRCVTYDKETKKSTRY